MIWRFSLYVFCVWIGDNWLLVMLVSMVMVLVGGLAGSRCSLFFRVVWLVMWFCWVVARPVGRARLRYVGVLVCLWYLGVCMLGQF